MLRAVTADSLAPKKLWPEVTKPVEVTVCPGAVSHPLEWLRHADQILSLWLFR